MSHYTIDYSQSENKEEQAIQDIINYLGQERFDVISTEITKAIKDGATVDDLTFPLAFAGVQGYPVIAWFNYCNAKAK